MAEKRKVFFGNAFKVVLYILFFYVIFLLGKSIWVNISLKKSIEKLNSQIVYLQEEKKNLTNLNIYYQSDSFRELEARRKLGMKRPDENLLIISTPASNTFNQELEEEKSKATDKKIEKNLSNLELWWQYFTK